MPVEPIPCDDGGTGTPGACACAPSIATSPLCRADGTPILVVLRSPCGTCGTPAPDPAVVGWVDPITGVFTPGAVPADAGPCAGTMPDTCSCAPSITAMPLCRPDGSTIALIIRSACADCGVTAPDPGIVGWLDPITGVFTPGPAPADATPCQLPGCIETLCRQRCDDTTGDGQADTTYSELWCIRADGSADLVLTYQDDPSVPYTPVSPVDCTYGCPDDETVLLCDDSGPFLRRYTFLNGAGSYEDVALDGMTPHLVTGTVGVCAADGDVTGGCADTVCRTRCDDTTGDGTADTTYSELWCVRADGTTELLLAYQDDPSAPYTPVSPVDCTLAYQDDETVMLCDQRPDGTTVPFLRRYTFLNGTGSYEDVALDGQTPHVVLGTVGVCPTDTACDSPTTPVATVGLCLADGTPIAVLITRDCDGVTSQGGWLNLATGTYSVGAPPAGIGACGDGNAFDLTGVLCDIDPGTGDVLGLVLVQYAYNPDGSLASVELLNAADGTPYTLQGELRNCPGGDELPEQDLAVLCDAQADGTAVPFLRDWRRTTAGLVTGYTDYTLAGASYAPTGTVGVCQPEPDPGPPGFTAPLLLCDVQPDGTVVRFLRRLAYNADGTLASTTNTALDGTTLYVPTGTVDQCPPDPVTVTPAVFHGELVLCDDLGPFVRKFVQDTAGAVTAVVNLTLDGTTYAPTGTVRLCQPEPDCPAQTVLEVCKCSDDDGDGIPETGYVELVAVDCAGALTTIGTYLPDYSAPYAPEAPMDCDAGEDLGAPPAFGVQARRLELGPGQSWSADTYPTLQSVTAIAHGDDATVTTADGTSTLWATESATWSVTRDEDARLTGPLTITAGPATNVTVTFAIGVKL